MRRHFPGDTGRSALSASLQKPLDLPIVESFIVKAFFALMEGKMKFEVKDMSCGGCARAITRAVTGIDPAARLDVDIAAKIVKIDSVLPPQRLAAAIEAAGFHPMVNSPSAD